MHILTWIAVYLIIGWMFSGAFVDDLDEAPSSFIFMLIWPVFTIFGLIMVLSWLIFKFGEKITKFVHKRRKKIHKKRKKQ